MKKVLFLSVLISLMFVFSELRSQVPPCPEGWTSGVFYGTIHNPYNNEDCDYDLYFCWMIDNNGQIVVKTRYILFWDKYSLAGLDLASNEYWDLFSNNMFNTVMNEVSSQVPPCPSSTTSISIRKVFCWHLEDLEATLENPNHSYLGLAPCDGFGLGNCKLEYSLCWDYSQTPAKLITTLIPQLPVGIVCPGISTPFDPFNPFSTECFSTCYY